MPVPPLAPIALFTYRRLAHLERVFDALAACPEFSASPVYAFSDAPKTDAAREGVAAVRRFLHARKLPNMTVVEAPTNRGLATSIIDGVAQLCDRHGAAIVIEDDLVVAPCTLEWFNEGLRKYAEDQAVRQIAAHQFNVPEFAPRDEGMFIHTITTWGWATWKRAWTKFDPQAAGWQQLKSDPALMRAFDLDGAYPYSQMLIDQMEGHSDSWGIRWQWSVFKDRGISLFPPRSMIQNIGNDETATHSRYRTLKRVLRSPLVRPLLPRQSEPLWTVPRCPRLPDRAEALPADDAAFSRARRTSRSLRNRLAKLSEN